MIIVIPNISLQWALWQYFTVVYIYSWLLSRIYIHDEKQLSPVRGKPRNSVQNYIVRMIAAY